MWTVSQGRWTCELPGDAVTPPTPRPEGNFSIVPDSSYIAIAGGRGTYLLLGKMLTMTAGPYAGQRFEKVGSAALIRLGADGKRLPERCVRAGSVSADFSDVPEG